jgi:hypothetical protein
VQTSWADRSERFILVGRRCRRFSDLITAFRLYIPTSRVGICLILCRNVLVHSLLLGRYSPPLLCESGYDYIEATYSQLDIVGSLPWSRLRKGSIRLKA